jgi:hypothetical protein
MSELTRILSAIHQGDPHAAEQLLPLVYDELRRLAEHKLAQEGPGQTLEATAPIRPSTLMRNPLPASCPNFIRRCARNKRSRHARGPRSICCRRVSL